MIPYTVRHVERREVKDFIEQHHYSHNINGLRVAHCFGLYDGDTLVGAMLYGGLAMANAWKKYGESDAEVLELRWLKKHTQVKTIVSYADPNYGHSGVIYRATNFTHVGMTSPGRVIMWQGKKYHDKAIRTKYKGELKPFAKRLKQALEEGAAHYEKQLPKHIYVKKLK